MLTLLLATLVALMPVTIMTGQSLPSTVYYLGLAAALGVLIQHRFAGAGEVQRHYRGLITCMAAPLLVVLFGAVWHRHLASTDLEIALRFLLGVWVFALALWHVPQHLLKQTIWGFVAAALAASGYIIGLSWPDWTRPDTDAVYNAVGYGNLTILLATLVLFSTRWTLTPWPRTERTFKLLVSVVTLGAFVLTQTRTGWIAVPLFVVIGAVLFTSGKRPARVIVSAVVALAAMATVFLSNDTLRQRAVLAYTETMDCQGDERTAGTSICVRLQLWRASLDMMKQNPVAGIGDRRRFRDQLQKDSLPKGIVSPMVAEGWGEPHNDLMLALASFGIPGGLALLLAYLAPAWVFMRRLALRYPDSVRTAAAMGLALCLGFLVFGMAETMLRGMRTASFYAMSVALFLTLSGPQQIDRKIR